MMQQFSKRHVTNREIQSAVIDLLAATNDGNDLDNRDLALCEYAANGKLSPLGVIAFIDVYRRHVTDYCGA